jgi:hypothetical protein
MWFYDEPEGGIMKTVLLPILLLAFITSSLIAFESEPSPTVGFIKYSATQGWSFFCLPFKCYKLNDNTLTETHALDDIIGNQMTGSTFIGNADQIINVYTGTYAWYNGTHWQAQRSEDLQFIDNTPYRFRHIASSTISVYLSGTVEQEAQYIGNFPIGEKFAALREAGSIPMADLDLCPGTPNGFTGAPLAASSDRIINPQTGAYAWFKSTNSTWQGSFTATVPGIPLIINVRAGHTPIEWYYDPTTRDTNRNQTPKSR